MKTLKYILSILILFLPVFAQAQTDLPAEALKRLQAGNARFVSNQSTHPNREKEVRAAAAGGQTPFAVILCCSDSRAPPEILFDEGIGDLFIVRVAGNVMGPVELASVEYGVYHLGAALVLVLGHENCGAVAAVIEGKAEDIAPVAELIAPAIAKAKTQKGSLVENAILDNVEYVVAALQKDKELDDLIQKNQLMVMGGYFELVSGKVRFLPK